MHEKKSFVLYRDFDKIFDRLTDREAGKLIKAIFAYNADGTVPTLSGMMGLGFDIIRDQLDRDAEKWMDVRAKRAAAGRIGGRSKKQTEAKKANAFFDKQTKADQTVNGDENVDGNVDVDGDGEGNAAVSAAHAHAYGTHRNVILTDEQLAQLRARYPQDWQKKIDYLSVYMASSGKGYADHFATLLLWARQDEDRRAYAPPPKKERYYPLPTATDRPPTFDLELYEAMTMRHRPLDFEDDKCDEV